MTEYLAQVFYDQTTNRWRHVSTGRFVARSTVQAELSRHIEAAQTTLQNLTRQLYAGAIDVAEWQSAIALELKDAHLAHSMFAVGGRRNMTFSNFGRVGRKLRDEYGYLNSFAADIAAERVSEAQALARIRQYGNNTGGSYWNEWQRQRDRPEWAGLLRLYRVPRDGSTQCRGNCRCELDEQEDGIHWIALDDEGTCADCSDMAAGGPYRPML